LWWTTNLLAGLLAVATTAFYVFVYTLLIKRRTSHNVVWGGAVNGMPVMIGWSAVTGTIGWQALVMFAIIFFWTPPHSWALAVRHREDYRAAGVPMLPAVATERHVAKRILRYTWLTVFARLSRLPPAGNQCGRPRRIVAPVMAHQLCARASRRAADRTCCSRIQQFTVRGVRALDRFGAGAANITGA
jgi:protoheme IX farnesyltransferase